MTPTDNFDADETETLDGEFEQTDMDAAPEDGAAGIAPPKKSGGAGKFIAVLAVLLIGGGVGAAKLGLLPFEIPGLSPAPAAPAPAPAHAATATPPAATPAAASTATPTSPSVPPMPAPATTNTAAMPAPLGAPAPANSAALNPVSGPDAAVPPFGAPANDKPATASAGDKKNDNAAFLPEGISHDGGPASIAPPSGSMMPPPLSDATAASMSAAKPDAKSDTKSPGDHKAEALHGVPTMPAVNPTPVSADALDAPAATTPPSMSSAMPSMTAPSSAAESEKVQKLEERIAGLEKTIADLKAGMASKSDVNDLRASLQHMSSAPAAPVETTGSPQAETATPAAPEAPRTPRHTSTHHHPAMTAPKSTLSATMATSHRWILKAATPNTAWVAAPGSSEIKAVAVGETLPGLGKITAVNKDSSGRWVVIGTRGKINQ